MCALCTLQYHGSLSLVNWSYLAWYWLNRVAFMVDNKPYMTLNGQAFLRTQGGSHTTQQVAMVNPHQLTVYIHVLQVC